jgi:heterodisulfide reductase subunit D
MDEKLEGMCGNMEHQKRASVLYYVGCTAAYRRPEIARATMKILRKAEVDFTLLNDEVCCGSVFIRAGIMDVAKELAASNLEKLGDAHVDTVVTSCSGCYRTFKIDYPTFVGSPPFQVLHIVELLLDLIESGSITFKKSAGSKLRVAYHDPCHLGRHCGIYEEPRRILEKIPGVEISEMEWTRDKSFCCGAGGGLKALSSDLAMSIARRRLDDALNRKAELVVSACPFCKHNLLDSANKYKLPIEVRDITEMVAENMG